jgi:hypothetical protein
MRVVAFAALLTLYTASARAQTTETPVPFDSAQRVLAVTPNMVDRLGLRAPVWPVTNVFREARLYSVAPGTGFTLVVQLSSGAFERFSLSPSDRTALGAAIDAGMIASGRPSADVGSDVVSEPAGNAFARRLTVYSALGYAPLAASLADEAKAATALYLLTTGLTYFVSYGAAQSTPFTRAQSDLAGDLGVAGGAAGLLTGYALTGNGDRGVRAAGLAGVVIGTMTGVNIARNMSDAEAHSTILGIELGAAVGVAASAAANDPQAMAIGAVVGGGVGLPLGLLYPRRAGYTVTAGDAQTVGTTGLIGAAFSAATLDEGAGEGRIGATLAGGYLVGAFVGERLLSRRFNLSRNQANVLKIGALAGGLLGAALPVLSDQTDPAVVFSAIGAGATLGVAALAGSFPKTSRASSPAVAPSGRGLGLSISPMGALAAARGVNGRHSLLRLTF